MRDSAEASAADRRLALNKLTDKPQRSQRVGRQPVPQASVERLGLQPALLNPVAATFGRRHIALPLASMLTRLGNSLVKPFGRDRPLDLLEVLGEQRQHPVPRVGLEQRQGRVRVQRRPNLFASDLHDCQSCRPFLPTLLSVAEPADKMRA